MFVDLRWRCPVMSSDLRWRCPVMFIDLLWRCLVMFVDLWWCGLVMFVDLRWRCPVMFVAQSGRLSDSAINTLTQMLTFVTAGMTFTSPCYFRCWRWWLLAWRLRVLAISDVDAGYRWHDLYESLLFQMLTLVTAGMTFMSPHDLTLTITCSRLMTYTC